MRANIRSPTGRHMWETRYDWDLQGGMEMWKPAIAAVNGYCIGEGLTLALACDFRIASDKAFFQFPEVQIGVPTIAGAIRAPRVIGLGAALELLLVGDRVDAARAYDMGLVNKVVSHDKLIAEAMRWADRLSRNAPQAMAATKEMAVRSQALSFGDALRMGEAFRRIAGGTEDAREGTRAFREKRPARTRASDAGPCMEARGECRDELRGGNRTSLGVWRRRRQLIDPDARRTYQSIGHRVVHAVGRVAGEEDEVGVEVDRHVVHRGGDLAEADRHQLDLAVVVGDVAGGVDARQVGAPRRGRPRWTGRAARCPTRAAGRGR